MGFAPVGYLPGTTGWDTTIAGHSTALWELPYPVILAYDPVFGVRSNRFGFIISWATSDSVIVEASTNLARNSWSAIATNILVGGWYYFSDPDWKNQSARVGDALDIIMDLIAEMEGEEGVHIEVRSMDKYGDHLNPPSDMPHAELPKTRAYQFAAWAFVNGVWHQEFLEFKHQAVLFAKDRIAAA